MSPAERRVVPSGSANRTAAGVVALVAWSGMLLQFYVSAGLMRGNGHGWPLIVARYFSYFTVLTNALVAVTTTVPLVAPASAAGRFFSRASVRAAVASYIALVGIAYSLLLRHVWNPQGLALVSDRIQHDLVPILYVLLWVVFDPKSALRWTDVVRWMIYPAVYVAFALVQGAMSGFYPYYFIDVTKLGLLGALGGVARLFLAFLVTALVVLGASRLVSRR